MHSWGPSTRCEWTRPHTRATELTAISEFERWGLFTPYPPLHPEEVIRVFPDCGNRRFLAAWRLACTFGNPGRESPERRETPQTEELP